MCWASLDLFHISFPYRTYRMTPDHHHRRWMPDKHRHDQEVQRPVLLCITFTCLIRLNFRAKKFPCYVMMLQERFFFLLLKVEACHKSSVYWACLKIQNKLLKRRLFVNSLKSQISNLGRILKAFSPTKSAFLMHQLYHSPHRPRFMIIMNDYVICVIEKVSVFSAAAFLIRFFKENNTISKQ